MLKYEQSVVTKK